MESQEKTKSKRKSSRNEKSSKKVYHVSDSDCDERQAKHDAYLAESNSDFEEELKGKNSKKPRIEISDDSDSVDENRKIMQNKKKNDKTPKNSAKFIKKTINNKKQNSGIKAGNGNVASTSHLHPYQRCATKIASIFEKSQKSAKSKE